MVLPLEDSYSVSRNELLDQLAYAMGGRVAEEIVFHDPTTGRIQRHREGHRRPRSKMVTEYGMSASIGSVKLGSGAGEVFLGRDMGSQRDYSERLSEQVDAEVRALIETAHDEAWQVLNENRDILDSLATALLEKETLDHVELAEIFKDVKKLPERPQWLSSDKRPVSDRPPVLVPDKAPIDAGAVDGGVDSSPTKPKRAPAARLPTSRPRSLPVAEPGPHRPDVARRARPSSGARRARVDRARIEAAVVRDSRRDRGGPDARRVWPDAAAGRRRVRGVLLRSRASTR